MQPNDAIFLDILNKDVSFIDTKLDEFIPLINDEQQIVRKAMKYSVGAKGKRIRPILVLEFCKLLGGNPDIAAPFASAIEMIHCYSLIHDDLPCMDDDDMRRGNPSCHIKYGEANALLAGDALLTLAFNVISSAENIPSDLRVKAIKVLSEYSGINGMIGGQVIDLKYDGNPINSDILHHLQLLKTGALLSAACKLGAIAADADTNVIETVGEYGEKVGLAFQIIDDILDVTGDEKQLGKPIGSDRENDKTTFVSLLGIEKSQKLALDYTNQAKEIIEKFDNTEFILALTDLLLDRKF